VKTNPTPAAVESTEQFGFWQKWQSFWLAPVAPLGLHWLRFLAGLLFLSWLAPLSGERAALFSLGGWLDREGYVEIARMEAKARAPQNPSGEMPMVMPGEMPPVLPGMWSLVYFCKADSAAFETLWWGSLTVLVLFTLGVWTRVTAVLAWVVVISFQANPAVRVEADTLLAALAFYLMLGYLFLGQFSGALTLRERLLGPKGTSVFALLRRHEDMETPPSSAANLAVRLVQIHFALAVVATALHKLQSGDWWSGIAYWFPLHRPFEMDERKILVARSSATASLFFMSMAEYLQLAWQLAFPVFAFRQRWRWLLLGGAVAAWVGMAYIYRVPTFGPLYVVACLSYLTPQEWRRLSDGLLHLVPARSAADLPALTAERRARIKTST
jgi:hypothetical protein